MELLEAIFTRHSQANLKPDPIPRNVIEKLLAAGVQAPNHYKVRPWRFVVLTGKGRERLGEVMATSMLSRYPDLETEAVQNTRNLAVRSPLLIAVGVDKPADPRVIELENVCAAAAACQNILLSAHALGLAAKWRTGDWATDLKVKEFLGFAVEQYLIAFLYIGYPEALTDEYQRPSFDDRVIFLDQ
jgi:nitroreductase